MLAETLLRLYMDSPEASFTEAVDKLAIAEAKVLAEELDDIAKSAKGCARAIRERTWSNH